MVFIDTEVEGEPPISMQGAGFEQVQVRAPV